MNDPYTVLEVSSHASAAEIKAAYRRLVKQHHPDAGGDDQQMLALNAAWEVLGDQERRRNFDRTRTSRPAASRAPDLRRARSAHDRAVAADDALVEWLRRVYAPIDRMLGEVINPFPGQFKALSADPYDDELMEVFLQLLGNQFPQDGTGKNVISVATNPSFGAWLRFECLSLFIGGGGCPG